MNLQSKFKKMFAALTDVAGNMAENTTNSLRDYYSKFPVYENVDSDDDESFDKSITELFIDYFSRVSALRRHEVLASWNFDHPKDILKWVMSQPGTDIATAQMIYWRMEPESVRDYEVDDDISILETIEHGINQGLYEDNGFAYDPRKDNGDAVLSNTEHTSEDEYLSELLKSRVGRQVEGLNTDNGIPEELYPAYERLVLSFGREDFYL